MAKQGNQGDGGGRPSVVFTESQVSQVEALASVLTKKQMADYFGIGETTLYEIEKRQPEVSEAYKKGKGKAIASIGTNLIAQAKNGNVTASIFYLKTQAGWKESDQTTVVTDRDNVVQVIRATRPD